MNICLICNNLVVTGEALIVMKGINNANETFTAKEIDGMIHIRCLKEANENFNLINIKFPITFIIKQ